MFNGHKWWHKVARTGSYNDLKDKPEIIIESVYVPSFVGSYASDGTNNVNLNISKDGYTARGIVGLYKDNNGLSLTSYRIYDTTAELFVRNLSSYAVTVSFFYINVLYSKNI